jgi:hypothetical protein
MRVKVHGEQRIFQTTFILLAKVVIHMRQFDFLDLLEIRCDDRLYRSNNFQGFLPILRVGAVLSEV